MVLKKEYMSSINEQVWTFYSLCISRDMRADYPTLLTWIGVMFVQAQDQQVTTRCPRIVTECSRTRSILIQMYVHV